jgi:hypothetical protein
MLCAAAACVFDCRHVANASGVNWNAGETEHAAIWFFFNAQVAEIVRCTA